MEVSGHSGKVFDSKCGKPGFVHVLLLLVYGRIFI